MSKNQLKIEVICTKIIEIANEINGECKNLFNESNKNMELKDLGFESLQLIELIERVEQSFQIRIHEKYLIPDNFKNLNSISELIFKTINQFNRIDYRR